MIFVTVGTAHQSFRRLLDSVDQLAGDGLFEKEIVIIQSGYDRDFRPRHCKAVDFFQPEVFDQMVQDASLVICHGAGTFFHAYRAGKIPVVMPRRKQYGEILDDTEIEFVRALAAQGRIIPAYEPADLPDAIAMARRHKAHPVPPQSSHMLILVRQAIEELIDKR